MRHYEGAMKPLSREARALGFQIHALAFVITMLLLVAINVWTGSPYWVQWVLPGWSLGLLSHWWFVLGPGARRSGTLEATGRSAPNSPRRDQLFGRRRSSTISSASPRSRKRISATRDGQQLASSAE